MKSANEWILYLVTTAVIALLFPAKYGLSAGKPRVALLDITAKNTSKTYGDVVRDILEVSIYKTDRFDMLERNKVETILNEQGFQMSGCTDASCAVQIGKLLSAEMVIVGSIIRLEKFTISVKLVDIKDGRIVIADSETAENEANIQSSVDILSRRISNKISKLQKNRSDSPLITPAGYYLRGIVPGWGQAYAGSQVKSYIFAGCFLASGTLAAIAYVNYDRKKSAYRRLPSGEPKTAYDSKYNDYRKATNIAIYSAGAFALIYIANWIDIIFFNSPKYEKSGGITEYNNRFVDVYFTQGGVYSGMEMNVSLGIRF